MMTARYRQIFLFWSILACVPASFLWSQDVVLRQDGQTGRDGKAVFTLAVQDGQQFLVRVASLDFVPKLTIHSGDQDYSPGGGDKPVVEQYFRVRGAVTSVQITVQNPAATIAGFQLRVLKYRDNPALSPGTLLKGVISDKDSTDEEGDYVDWYPLPVRKGQRLFIGLSASDADAYLKVEFPDGSRRSADDSVGTDAHLILDIAQSGTIQVGASILLGDKEHEKTFSHPYSVYVRDFPDTRKALSLGSAGLSATFTTLAPDVPPLPDNYSFVAPKGGIYRFVLNGKDGLSTQLRVRINATKELSASSSDEADDSGNSELRYYLRSGQKVDIGAFARPFAGKPTYTIAAVSDGDATLLKDGDALDQTLAVNKSNFYIYRGRAGEYAQFLAASDDFEATLVMNDVLGQEFSWSEYYGSDFMYAAMGGYYFDSVSEIVLQAHGATKDSEGKFRISVKSSLSGGADAPREYPQKTQLSSGNELFARLTSAHPVLDGSYADEYVVDLKAGALSGISMQSYDVDTVLKVFGPDAQEVAENDDYETVNSYVEFVAAKAGRYTVRAYSYVDAPQPLNTSYTINYENKGTVVPLVGDPVQGSISQSSAKTDDGMPYETVTQRLNAGQRLYAVAHSDDFNPKLQVLDRDGTLVAENDDYGQGSDARIDLKIARSGPYTIRIINVSGDEAEAAGNFVLSLSEIK